MKSTGVTRRIDELGRIVIPKEIRKNLGIREGEFLGIFVEDNKIILQKQMAIESSLCFLSNILDILLNIYDLDIIVTDRDSIIYSKDKNMLKSKISKNMIRLMDSREIYSSLSCETISITDKIYEGYFYILPVIVDTDILGLIILHDIQSIDEEKKKLMNFIQKLICNYLSI